MPSTGLCVNPRTEDRAACPSNNFASSALCEFSDANCMPLGDRNIITDGVKRTVSWPLAGCQDNVFQNGDLDFDGTPYTFAWPDGTPGHPTPFDYFGPFTGDDQPYPTVQFETDLPASENLCNVVTGAGCTAPPLGARFYPFWTIGTGALQGRGEHRCLWNFGTVIPSVTTQTFGGAAEYGTPDVARFAGTLTSQLMPNPQFSGACSAG
jgi:hypothetical protein